MTGASLPRMPELSSTASTPAIPDLPSTKPRPRWDVHSPEAGNRAGNLAGVLRPLTAGPSGSGASPRLSGWPVRPGSCRPSPALSMTGYKWLISNPSLTHCGAGCSGTQISPRSTAPTTAGTACRPACWPLPSCSSPTTRSATPRPRPGRLRHPLEGGVGD